MYNFEADIEGVYNQLQYMIYCQLFADVCKSEHEKKLLIGLMEIFEKYGIKASTTMNILMDILKLINTEKENEDNE